jgi:hypothetical protein
VDLTNIQRLTHLDNVYAAVQPNLLEPAYSEAIRNHTRFIRNMAPMVRGMEAVYEKWCGHYDADVPQLAMAYK